MEHGYYVGFSVTRHSLVSLGIRAFTRSDVSHTFILLVAKKASTVFHVDDGRFEIIDLDTFLSKNRQVMRLYRIPVSDRKSLAKAVRWFIVCTRKKKTRKFHTIRMAVEWAFRLDIEHHQIAYCTQGLSDFLRIAELPYMVQASQRVVCPKTFENWIKVNRWEECQLKKKKFKTY